MKSGFASAMLALSAIQNGDKRLEATVDANRVEHERQLTDVLHMLLALKVCSPPKHTPTPSRNVSSSPTTSS